MIMLNEKDALWRDELYAKLEKKLARTAAEVKDIIPYMIKDGKYTDMSARDATWWTNGFFGGMMWLMYKESGKEIFKTAAQKQGELLAAAWKNYEGLHHDVGFMWGLTAKSAYRLTGDTNARLEAIYAANLLAARYNILGNYISSWNGNKKAYSIIDSMMNIPLLYWASRELGHDRFKYVALRHADMTMREHVREDGSVVHIAVHNEEKDEVIETLAGQGYAVGSAWSRGQAWAVYGFMLSYIHTGDKKYLETSMKTADYFLEKAALSDYKVRTDFCAPMQPEYYDTSAAVCAACGMIEIYKATEDEKYLQGAIRILQALEDDLDFSEKNQSILQNSMASYESAKHMHLIYADFFLCEAIIKLRNSDFLIW